MHNTASILNVYTEHVCEYLGTLMHNRFIFKLIDTMVFGGEGGILRIYTTVYVFRCQQCTHRVAMNSPGKRLVRNPSVRIVFPINTSYPT